MNYNCQTNSPKMTRVKQPAERSFQTNFTLFLHLQETCTTLPVTLKTCIKTNWAYKILY